MSRRKYQRYSTEVKLAITVSQNPNLFPNLLIPKSTVRHWIRQGVSAQQGVALPQNTDFEANAEALAVIIKCLGDDVNLSLLSDLELERLRGAVFSRGVNVKSRIRASLWNKFRRILSPCNKSADGRCLRRFSSQLTGREVAIMKRLVTSVRYAHMSISSLSLFAVREKLLLCSNHTWYKYIAQHNWARPHKKIKKSPRSRGLKAKEPNEIWHIDVSHVTTSSGKRYFLQVVMDNFSRFIIAWSLRDQIAAADTERLIKRARRAVVDITNESFLIADGGPENVAKRVTAAIDRFEPKLIRKIARKEIRNGNTMVEIFFKMLKNNHLYHAMQFSRRDLVREISFYVKQHNHIVPMRALDGDTPAESLNLRGNKLSSDVVAGALSERRSSRMIENRSGLCEICL